MNKRDVFMGILVVLFFLLIFASLLCFYFVSHRLEGLEEKNNNLVTKIESFKEVSDDIMLYQVIEDIWFSKAGEYLSHQEIRDLSVKTYKYHKEYGSSGTTYPLGLDYWKIFSVIEVESGFNPMAESYVGAIGLMQVMPLTATGVLEKNFNMPGLSREEVISYLKDPVMNFMIGVNCLITLQRRFIAFGVASKDDWKLALSRYNWGTRAVSSLMEAYDKGTPKASLRYALSVEKKYGEFKK